MCKSVAACHLFGRSKVFLRNSCWNVLENYRMQLALCILNIWKDPMAIRLSAWISWQIWSQMRSSSRMNIKRYLKLCVKHMKTIKMLRKDCCNWISMRNRKKVITQRSMSSLSRILSRIWDSMDCSLWDYLRRAQLFKMNLNSFCASRKALCVRIAWIA